MSDFLETYQTNTAFNQPKLVETYNNIVLLNNVYQKTDLSFVNRSNLIFNVDSGFNVLNLSRYMILSDTYDGDTHPYGDKDKYFGVVKDLYFANRCYFMVNNHRSNRNRLYSYILSCNENDNELVINKITNIKNVEWQQIVDQNNDFLFVVGMAYPDDPNTGNWTSYERLYKIDKTTMEATMLISSTNNKQFSFVYKDQRYICVLFFYPKIPTSNRYGYYIARYDKNNNIAELIEQTPVDNGWGLNPRIEDFYIENDKYYWIAPFINGATGFARLYYDKENNNINYLDNILIDNINFSTFTDYNSGCAVSSNGYIVYRQWIIDNYLYYISYDETKRSTDILVNQGIYIFKINPGFELEYITKQEISNDKRIISMTFNSDKKNMLIGYTNSFELYVYNDETHLYDSNDSIIEHSIIAGFDSCDKLWYMNTNYGVYTEDLGDPQAVNMKFEKIHYGYGNVDIDTYISFEAKSFIKTKPPIGTYIFTLSGQAYFKDNKDKTINIDYEGGEITIPIVITGSKRIGCSVKFIK